MHSRKLLIGILQFAPAILVLLCGEGARADAVPNGWAQLHLVASHGTEKETLRLLSTVHDVNGPVDNREQLGKAYEARERALHVLREGRKIVLRPVRNERETNSEYTARLRMWEESDMDWIEWRDKRAAAGTYLQILGRFNLAILQNTLWRTILLQRDYERCRSSEEVENSCDERREKSIVDVMPEQFNLTLPMASSTDADVYTPYLTLLAEAQLALYSACVKHKDEQTNCAHKIPPVVGTWENIHAIDTTLLSSPTPTGVLDMVLAENMIREATRDDDATPLALAAGGGKFKNVRTLLGRSANPQTRASDGTTPLHRAAEVDDQFSVRYLLAFGAEIEAQNNRGYTALHVAAAHQAYQSAHALLNYGANANAETDIGETPLWLSVLWEEKGEEMRELLEEYGGKCGSLCEKAFLEPEFERRLVLPGR